jgi:two-component system chemotaxis response regulator CheY
VLRQFASRFSSKKLCLIADSSVVIRKAAASILSDLCFQITEAEDDQEALSKCYQRTPDAVLIDGAIARPNQFEFLRTLSQEGAGRGPKIILCTADRDPSQIARAFEAGAHEYVIKPFDRMILTAKFEKLGLTA